MFYPLMGFKEVSPEVETNTANEPDNERSAGVRSVRVLEMWEGQPTLSWRFLFRHEWDLSGKRLLFACVRAHVSACLSVSVRAAIKNTEEGTVY